MQRYEQRRVQRESGSAHFYVRPLRIIAGALLVIISPLVGAIPGPGGVLVFLPGAFLLASEVRHAAIIMDRMENETIPRIRRFHARLRGGPKREWVEAHPELWTDWCERRQMDMPDTGKRRRAVDSDVCEPIKGSMRESPAPGADAEAASSTREDDTHTG